MIFNERTKKYEISKSRIDKGDHVTSDGIVFSKDYTLIYEIPGYMPTTFKFKGKELYKSISKFLDFLDCEQNKDIITQAGRKLNSFVTIMATYRIDKILFESVVKGQSHFPRDFIDKQISLFDKKNSFLKECIGSYLYFRLYYLSLESNFNKVIKLTDYQIDDSFKELMKNDWKDQSITKRLNFKTFDEFLHYTRCGYLTITSFKDMKDYNSNQSV